MSQKFEPREKSVMVHAGLFGLMATQYKALNNTMRQHGANASNEAIQKELVILREMMLILHVLINRTDPEEMRIAELAAKEIDPHGL